MLIDISPKGELLSGATPTLRYCHDINQNGEDEEGIEFAKYTERKEGDYSERRTRESRCGITFRKTFWLYYRPVSGNV